MEETGDGWDPLPFSPPVRLQVPETSVSIWDQIWVDSKSWRLTQHGLVCQSCSNPHLIYFLLSCSKYSCETVCFLPFTVFWSRCGRMWSHSLFVCVFNIRGPNSSSRDCVAFILPAFLCRRPVFGNNEVNSAVFSLCVLCVTDQWSGNKKRHVILVCSWLHTLCLGSKSDSHAAHFSSQNHIWLWILWKRLLLFLQSGVFSVWQDPIFQLFSSSCCWHTWTPAPLRLTGGGYCVKINRLSQF